MIEGGERKEWGGGDEGLGRKRTPVHGVAWEGLGREKGRGVAVTYGQTVHS
jgi:hypothetical protein